MRKLILFFAFLLLAILCSARITAVDDGDLSLLEERVEAAQQGFAANEIIVKFSENIADALEEQLEPRVSAGELILPKELDELNARYKVRKIRPIFRNFKQRRQRLEALRQKSKELLSKKEKHILKRLKRAPKGLTVPDLDRIYKIKVDLDGEQSLEEVVAAYNNDPNVEYAELNYIVSINNTPNDPCYPIQWPLNNTGQMYPDSGKCKSPPGTPDCDIDAPEAWDIHTGSSEIIVAVVDTGVDCNHRDLQANMWTDSNGFYGYDFFNDDNDPMDDHGHGTHCAGIIAADSNNGLDIAGVCWNAKIMAVKFIGAGGSGPTEGAVNAIEYATDMGADVISNSWGGENYSETLEEAVAYAYSQGVVVVAAAGNSNYNLPGYPARYDQVISVAATDSDDQRAICTYPWWASNYGNLVDIAAPGVDVLSLRAAGTSIGTPYNDYTTIASGTSMACPHVAGACALMLSRYPDIQVDELEQHLTESTDPIYHQVCASGRLNVYEAMLRIPGAKGIILLETDYYSCSALVGIKLLDLDLKENGTQHVTVSTGGGDSETVILTETVPAIGVFTGTISTGQGDPNTEDGTVQISHGEVVTVTYYDANDGTGNPAAAVDTAMADCEAPVISNVQVETRGIAARITFETNEPTIGRVRCGLACGGPYTFGGEDSVLATSHTIQLNGLPSETTCYFVVDANDAAGNQTTDDNSGMCYSFVTGTPIVLNVPSEYPTIQAAIDAAWSWGDTIIVAIGTYYENINFHGKDIVLRSTNPNDPDVVEATIIDGNDANSVVTFSGTESGDCVLTGFTITGGKKGIPLYVDIQEELADIEPNWIGWDDDDFPISLSADFDDNFSATLDYGLLLDNGDWQTEYPPGPEIADVLEDGYRRYQDGDVITLTFSNLKAGDYAIGTFHVDMTHPNDFPKSTFAVRVDGTVVKDWAATVGRDYPLLGQVYFLFTSNGSDDVVIELDGAAAEPSELNEVWLNGFMLMALWGGGGIAGNGSLATISKCVITDNWASYGGGLYDCDGLIQHNIIRNNWVSRIVPPGMVGEYGHGGGLYDCDGLIQHNIITGNDSGGGRGGGLYLCDGTIWSNIISDNGSYWGGGMSLCDGPVQNNVLVGNVSVKGGAFASCQGSISNCTLVGNYASNGSGIYECYGGISNCIIWRNGAGIKEQIENCSTPIYSCIEDFNDANGTGNINSDPCFVSIGYWQDMGFYWKWVDNGSDYHLQSDSLCINAGDPNGNYEGQTDLDGQPRLMMGRVDIGAYEFDPNMPLIKVPSVIEFYGMQGGANPDSQILSISNCGGGVLNWQITYDCNWLEVDPCQGSSMGEINEVTLSVDTSGLSVSEYHCEMKASDPCALNNPRTVVVKLYVIGNRYVPAEYPTIQAAIDVANKGDTIIVADGIYTGEENRDIDFQGKAITVKSENGPNGCIVDCQGTETEMHRGFYFHSAEGANSILEGLTILNGYSYNGGGIRCEASSPMIRNCIITGNTSYWRGGGVHCIDDSSPMLINCTISGNRAINEIGGGCCADNSNPTISSCILWGDTPDEIYVESGSLVLTYSVVEGSWTGRGNIDSDPCFAEAGYWDANGTPGNIDDDFWVEGDYHLQSQVGRWARDSESWVKDANTSRGIDAGNPGCSLGDEPNDANNVRINMGAYGGTLEASMPPYGWALLSDITNDGTVDFVDFAYFADMFTDQDDELPSDFKRDGDVDLGDAALLTEDWLQQTSWYVY